MSHSLLKEFEIGSRVQIGEDRATIKYIGAVNSTKGEWLGVEWDNPARGKHNGSHEGKTYFTCQHATSGSFIRYHPDKVRKGITFLDALKQKYLMEDDTVPYDKEADRGEIYVGDVKFETVGFQKIQQSQSDLRKLKVVGLAEQCIASCGPVDEFPELHIQDLDLSRNLISKWNIVIDIISKLPDLRILRLNQLRFQQRLPDNLQRCFPNIQTLALNRSSIQWSDIEPLLCLFPNLQDLQLGTNSIKEITPFSNQQHIHLRCINLENNLLSDWQQVLSISETFPQLDTLFLNNNKICKITPPTTEMAATPPLMNKLKYLRIEHNMINGWESIDMLNDYTGLQRLNCKENPIFNGLDTDTQLAQIVGRVKHVENVNGNTITKRDRTDFERYYLKKIAIDSANGFTHNKRYEELCLIHGQPNAAEAKQSQSTNPLLKNRLVELTLSLYQTEEAEDEVHKFVQSHLEKPITVEQLPASMRAHTQSLQKKCLPTMTVRNLRSLIQRLFKISFMKQRLYLIQKQQEEQQEENNSNNINDREEGMMVMITELGDDLKDLRFYGIKTSNSGGAGNNNNINGSCQTDEILILIK